MPFVPSSSTSPSSHSVVSPSPTTRKFCLSVFICQMTILLSCIILLYLTLIVSPPTTSKQPNRLEARIPDSEFVEEPVTCAVVSADVPKNCDGDGKDGCWNSFQSWPAKEHVSCPRIFVNVRNKGDELRFEGCEDIEKVVCSSQGDESKDRKGQLMIDRSDKGDDESPKLCYKGDCAAMSGLFNCTVIEAGGGPDDAYGSQCRDVSSDLECQVPADAPGTSRRYCQYVPSCLNIEGVFHCEDGSCTRIDLINCKPFQMDFDSNRHICDRGECGSLTGLFNCTEGTLGSECRDISSKLECPSSSSGDTTDNNMINCHLDSSNCKKLSGLVQCTFGVCNLIVEPATCTSRCEKIKTDGKSVLIRNGNAVVSTNCKRVTNSATGQEIWPLQYKSINKPNILPILLINCMDIPDIVDDDGDGYFILSDCFNGTLVEPDIFKWNTSLANLRRIQFSLIAKVIAAASNDNNGTIGRIVKSTTTTSPTSSSYPLIVGKTESELMIYLNTELQVDYENCMNSTSVNNICNDLYKGYCETGKYLPSINSIFQCLFSPNSSTYVKAAFK